MATLHFIMKLDIEFEDVPEDVVTAFTEEGGDQTFLNSQIVLVLESFIRDYYRTYFDGYGYEDAVKDLFCKTHGAMPTIVVEDIEEV